MGLCPQAPREFRSPAMRSGDLSKSAALPGNEGHHAKPLETPGRLGCRSSVSLTAYGMDHVI
eukprot:2081987-Alexandrium_andersonii.AAC.1